MEILMERIAVLQTAFLGDSVLTLPLLQEIKKRYPNSRLEVITLPAQEQLFRLSPAVDEVIVFDKRNKHKTLSGFFDFAKELKERQYTQWYSPHRSFRSTMLMHFAAPAISIGFSNASFSLLYSVVREYMTAEHEIVRNLNLLEGFSLESKTLPLPEVILSAGAEALVEEFFRKNEISGKFILIAPGSVWATKQYPPGYFSRIAKTLQRSGYKVFWFGSDKDKEIAEKAGNDSGAVNCCGMFPLEQSLVLLKKASLLICNDSAPAHLASAVRTKTLMLYCATVPDFGFTPTAPGSRWLSENMICKPCNIHGAATCPQEHFACGANLLPEKVISAALEMLTTE